MAKKREKSAVEIQYEKERKRLTQQVRRMEKRGYVFKETPVPKKPKKIDEGSVRNLQKRSTSYLYEKAKYVEKETGKQISAEEGRKQERQASARKAVETRQRRKRRPAEYRDEDGDYGGYGLPPRAPTSSGTYDFDVMYRIQGYINDLIPDELWCKGGIRFNNTHYKNYLISLVDETYNDAELEGREQQYLDYLHEHEDEIKRKAEEIEYTYASEGENIKRSFGNLMETIIGRKLTSVEALEVENGVEHSLY